MGILFIGVPLLLIAGTLWLWRFSRPQMKQVPVIMGARLLSTQANATEQPSSNQVQEDEGERSVSGFGPLPKHPTSVSPSSTTVSQTIECSGKVALPQKVYVGDSQNITLTLKVVRRAGVFPKTARIQETEQGTKVVLKIPQPNHLEAVLEVEVLAAGLTIDGEKKQQQALSLDTLIYRWSCFFPNAGNQVLTLIFREVSHSDTRELVAIQHAIKVTRLARLSQHQVEAFAAIGGIASFVSTILGIAGVLHII